MVTYVLDVDADLTSSASHACDEGAKLCAHTKSRVGTPRNQSVETKSN